MFQAQVACADGERPCTAFDDMMLVAFTPLQGLKSVDVNWLEVDKILTMLLKFLLHADDADKYSAKRKEVHDTMVAVHSAAIRRTLAKGKDLAEGGSDPEDGSFLTPTRFAQMPGSLSSPSGLSASSATRRSIFGAPLLASTLAAKRLESYQLLMQEPGWLFQLTAFLNTNLRSNTAMRFQSFYRETLSSIVVQLGQIPDDAGVAGRGRAPQSIPVAQAFNVAAEYFLTFVPETWGHFAMLCKAMLAESGCGDPAKQARAVHST